MPELSKKPGVYHRLAQFFYDRSPFRRAVQSPTDLASSEESSTTDFDEAAEASSEANMPSPPVHEAPYVELNADEEPNAARSAESQEPSGFNIQRIESLLVKSWMRGSLELLGIQRSTNEVLHLPELKKAYRIKALAFHPDKNPSPQAQEVFVQIANAYEKMNAHFCGMEIRDEFSKYKYADIWRGQAELSQDLAELHRDFAELDRNLAELSKGFQYITEQCRAGLATLALNQQRLEENARKGEKQDRALAEIERILYERLHHQGHATLSNNSVERARTGLLQMDPSYHQRMSTSNYSMFSRIQLDKNHLIEHRHDNAATQHAYDLRFGISVNCGNSSHNPQKFTDEF